MNVKPVVPELVVVARRDDRDGAVGIDVPGQRVDGDRVARRLLAWMVAMSN